MAGVGRAVQWGQPLKALGVSLWHVLNPRLQRLSRCGAFRSPQDRASHMNSHVQFDTQSATPVTIKAAPSLSELLQAHQKITDLISTVPSGVGANNLREAAEELLYDITQARAATWEEFGRKVQILVDQTTEASHEGWLTAAQEGVYWDLKQLNGEAAKA